jgi:hypothetical protein
MWLESWISIPTPSSVDLIVVFCFVGNSNSVYFIWSFQNLQSQVTFIQTNKSNGTNKSNMENEELVTKVSTKVEPIDISSNNSTGNTQQKCCASCHLAIDDRYIFNLMNTYWHEECLQCSQCGQLLNQTCFFKNGLLFCKGDYLKWVVFFYVPFLFYWHCNF